MQGKLRQLMKHEGINSTRLAEILGIQASGISHIMSGRNKPSFDFLLKLLQRFPQINPDWLLLDKGPMYRNEIKQKPGTGNLSGPRGAVDAGGTGSSVDFGSSVGLGSPGGFGGTGSAGIAVGGQGGSGSAGGSTGTGSADGGAVFGSTGASGGLFGPDNNDIISAGSFPREHSGGYPAGYQGAQADRQTALPKSPNTPQNAPPNTPPNLYQSAQQKLQQLQHAQEQARQQVGQQAGQSNPQQAVQQLAQPTVYQSGGFTRSASIERIVVFYKDKTFSEYQPE